MCRPKSGRKGRKGAFASSVMLLDCAKLRHWRFEENFAEMFKPSKRDYMDWVSLKLEDPATIGLLENQWNDFDNLTEQTKLLHNTKRKTQPWKTGLKVDYRPADTFQLFPPATGCAAPVAPCSASTSSPAPTTPTRTPTRKSSSSAW